MIAKQQEPQPEDSLVPAATTTTTTTTTTKTSSPSASFIKKLSTFTTLASVATTTVAATSTVLANTNNLTNSTQLDTTAAAVEPWRNNFFGLQMPVDVLSILYATTVAAGGGIGYLTKGSVPSLIAGLSFGLVLGFGAYQTSVNPRNYALITGTSGALAGLMGYRFYNSGKFMPAGLICTLSTLMVIRFAIRYFTDKNFI